MLIIHVGLMPKPGCREEFLRAAAEAEAATQGESGCLHYGFVERITAPGEFMLVECWAEEDALKAHLERPHVRGYLDAVRDILQRHDAVAYDVSGSRPL